MSLLESTREAPGLPRQRVPGVPRAADATTLIALFVALQFVLPSTLVLNYLPLSLSAASVTALGLGVLWVCTQMTTTLGAAKGRTPVRTALFIYAIATLASYGKASFTALPGDERSSSDHAMVTVFAMICLGLAVCDGVRGRDRIYFLLRAIVLCTTWVALVGIIQYLLLFDLTRYMRLPGMQFSESYSLVLVRGGLPRVAGTTEHPIEFGVLCAMVLPLAVHVASTTARGRRRPILWWSCAGLIAAGIMFSASRSAILAVMSVSVVLFLGWTGRRRLWMLASGMVFLALIKVVSPGLIGNLLSLFRNTNRDDSVRYRTHDYATAGDVISQSPWLGRGIGTWYAPKRVVFDNQYLLTLVESGVIGLVTLLGIVFAAMYSVRQVGVLSRRSTAPGGTAAADRDLALAIAASLVAILPTFATFDFATFTTVNALMFLVTGIAAALLRAVRAEPTAATLGTLSPVTDVWRSVHVLVRRWYVVIPTALCGLVLAGAAYSVTPTQYESASILSLTTPMAGSSSSGPTRPASSVTNPLTNFDPNLNLTAAIIIQEMNSAAAAKHLAVPPGGSIEYEVTNGSSTPQLLAPGPFVFVRGTAPTPAEAEAIAQAAADLASQTLAERQRDLGAPASTRIEMLRVLPTTQAEPDHTSALRLAVVVLALGVLTSMGAAYGLESFATRARRSAGLQAGLRESTPEPPDSCESDVILRDGTTSAATADRAVGAPTMARIDNPTTSARR